MEKLKGYVGIATALVLLVFLLPVGGSWAVRGTRLTPVDNTVISRLTVHHTTEWKFLQRVNYFLNSCDKGTPDYRSTGYDVNQSCAFLFENVPFEGMLEAFFSPQSGLDESLINRWTDYRRAVVPNQTKTPELADERRALAKPLGLAIVKYADFIRLRLLVWLYGANLGLALLFLLALNFRRDVGGVPVALLVGLLKGSAKTAKRVHDKI